MTINSRSPEIVNPFKKMINLGVTFVLRDGTRLDNLHFDNNNQLFIGQKSMNSFLNERTAYGRRWLNHVYFDSGGKKILLKSFLTPN